MGWGVERYLSFGHPLGGARDLSPMSGSATGTSVPGRSVPVECGCEKQQRLLVRGVESCRVPGHSFWKACAWNYLLKVSFSLGSCAGSIVQKALET